jgi:citrate synthase
MKAPLTPGEREENETNKGLRVADRGFLNTAVMRSEITYIDGDAGGDLYSLNAFIVLISYVPFHFKVLRYR